MSWDFGCERTGKRRYPTLEEAQQAGIKTARRGYYQKAYKCPFCHGHHMTHMLHETRARDFHKRGRATK